MVPFGKHRVLTEDEINKVTEYIWTLCDVREPSHRTNLLGEEINHE
jgi:hypothetical protein